VRHQAQRRARAMKVRISALGQMLRKEFPAGAPRARNSEQHCW
jgi:hypothetical protein